MTPCRPKTLMLFTLLSLVVLGGCMARLPLNGRQGTLPPGEYYGFFADDEGSRRGDFLVRVPQTAAERPPLLVALHGVSNNGRLLMRKARLDVFAERTGMVVLLPQGMGLFGIWRHWNAGFCCGLAHEKRVDDAAFVRRCIERVCEVMPIDRSRIYIMGHSNGGMLAYAVASRWPEMFRAVAVVSGTAGGNAAPELPFETLPPPDYPVPLVAVHGERDEAMPPAGGESPLPFLQQYGVRLSLEESLGIWRKGNSCDRPAEEGLRCEGRVLQRDWCGGDSDGDDPLEDAGRRHVRLLLYKDWPHAWPGPGIEGIHREVHDKDVYEALGLEPLPGGCSAEELILEFFSQQE